LLMKVAKAKKFIEAGHKVQINLRLRGREKAANLRDWSKTKMQDFKKMLDFPHKLTQDIQFDGKQFTIRIDPTS